MTTSESTESPASILIVDDTPANLQVLSDLLRQSDYKVRPIPSGKLALKAASASPPDLILLDITMPEMNGYEVCNALKADPQLSDIPVIFISALNETMDKVKAFKAGGVDYIIKPFQFEEVQARVSTHLNLSRLQKLLVNKNQALESSLARQKELEQMRDNLIHMVVHDLRSPLSGVIGYLSLLDMKKEPLSEKQQRYVTTARKSSDQLMKLINELLDVNKLESEALQIDTQLTDLRKLSAEAIELLSSTLGTVNLLENYSIDCPSIRLDQDLIRRVIVNLLSNAIAFSPPGSEITLCLDAVPEGLKFSVIDAGPGIPEADQARIFEKFGQIESQQAKRKYSTGLGLTFCKMALEAHAGQIGVTSIEGQGSRFWFTLPLEQTTS